MEQKYFGTPYFDFKYNEIENTKKVEHIIRSLDLENQRELKKQLTPEQRKELKLYFAKELA